MRERGPVPGASIRLAVARRGPAIVVALLIGLAVVTRIPTLGQPLLGIHAFRQTQTAYGSLMLHERGFDLLHAELPILGPPWQVPFELPLFQASAALLMGAGLDPDAADRLASLVWFAVSAFLLWTMARRLAGQVAALVATAWYLFMPLSILWSRGATIEYLAVAAALAAVVATLRWLDTGRTRWLAVAVAAATVAGLVKITTLAAWLIPVAAILVALTLREQPRRPGRIVGLGAVIAIPLAVGAAWTAYADSIKAGSPWTDDLTSARLVDWNFGTIGQRLDPAVWAGLAAHLVLFVLGVVALVLLPFAALRIARSGERRALAGIALVAIVTPLVFIVLYSKHDYYWTAISPAWAMLVGLGAAGLLELARTPRRGAAMVAAILGCAFLVGAPYWGLAYEGVVDPSDVAGQASRVAALTMPDDLVVVEGNDWSAEVLYQSRRRGIAIPANAIDAAEWEALAATDPGIVELVDPATTSRISVLSAWPWVGPLDPQLYRVSRTSDGLDGLPVAWTDGVPATVSATLATRDAAIVACGGSPLRLDAAPPGGDLWLGISGAPEAEARVWVADGRGPVPASGVVRIRGVAAEVTCAGTASVRITAAILPSPTSSDP